MFPLKSEAAIATLPKTIRFLAAMIITVLWGFLPLHVHADDSEIYFNRDTGESAPSNVMLALDTSGSMEARLQNDPEGRTRLQTMKDTVVDFLKSVDNINIGMMRFNGEHGGGAVIHPIAHIDEITCDSVNCDTTSVNAKVTASDDDAEQLLYSGTMDLNSSTLTLGQESGFSDKRRAALRFDNLRVPSGAVISSARLVVTSASDDSSPTNLSIRVENNASSAEFTANRYNVSNRPTNGTSNTWVPRTWSKGTPYESPDISNLVQSVVQRQDWCGGNALTLFIDGDGTRSIETYNAGTGGEARLILEYDTSNITPTQGCSNHSLEKRISRAADDARETTRRSQVTLYSSNRSRFYISNDGRNLAGIVGLRYEDIDIPQGAVIKNAYLEFVTVGNSRGSGNLRIYGLSGGDTPAFTSRIRDISSRRIISPSVFWGNVYEEYRGSVLRSPNIAQVIQAIVNQETWSSGNALGFRVDSDNRFDLEVESYDTDTALAPKLFVEYGENISAQAGKSQKTVRDDLMELTENLEAEGGTPIADVLYEAALYFNGGDVDFGKTRGGQTLHESHRVSHPDSYTGGRAVTPPQCIGEGREEWDSDCKREIITGDPVYTSPIKAECQPNSIVLLSDGDPTSTFDYDHLANLTGSSCDTNVGCINEIANWMSTTDHAPRLTGQQDLTVHTISFAEDSPRLEQFLKNVAEAGGGQSFTALNASELSSVFDNVTELEKVTNTTFPVPGAAVNQFNRLSNDGSIYFSLFEPTQGAAWPGNLKKYNLLTNDDETVEIVDAKDDPAIDPDTGFFFNTARSEWSDRADGNEVSAGGAASKIRVNDNITGPRRVYTYTGTNAPDNENLNDDRHQLHETNSEINHELLAIQGESENYRTQLLQWARGVDVFDENDDGDTADTRLYIGDPLHTGPIAVNYDSAGGPNPYVFVTTNEGYLHVLDAETGKEVFAFIPQELLRNLDRLNKNSQTSSHLYGLDGQLSFYHDDTNENRLVDSNETALLFFGMRRGGNSYYALDVRDLSRPKLKWVIKGGENGTPGFEEMGQTWAKAQVAKIQSGSNKPRPVLVMGAGYDQNKDDTPNNPTLARRPDNVGRGIFVVDALTGERLWSASPTPNGNNHKVIPELEYSIPSSVRVIDIDGDGFSDQMYVGDTGGQIWRFDFVTDPNSSLFADGGLLADFGGRLAKDARRFYSAPDMALVNKNGQLFLSLGIGSGWRAHPLDEDIEDRFYTLQMPITYGAQANYGKAIIDGGTTFYHTYSERDLLDVTENFEPNAADINNASGWMRRLDFSGEKVLSSSLTVDNKIVFTTYEPNFTSSELCYVGAGLARVYAVNAFDGSPVQGFSGEDSSGSSGLGKDDLYKELALNAIPSNPNITGTADGNAVLHVGTEIIDGIFEEKPSSDRTWWMEAVREE